ncbi:MAG: hypothetical protein Q7U14_12105 [Lacisediminimonas sp.]|nr:hypothetical protein [Lacisediminimonas sp.]
MQRSRYERPWFELAQGPGPGLLHPANILRRTLATTIAKRPASREQQQLN